jgi:hypothetical protein
MEPTQYILLAICVIAGGGIGILTKKKTGPYLGALLGFILWLAIRFL